MNVGPVLTDGSFDAPNICIRSDHITFCGRETSSGDIQGPSELRNGQLGFGKSGHRRRVEATRDKVLYYVPT